MRRTRGALRQGPRGRCSADGACGTHCCEISPLPSAQPSRHAPCVPHVCSARPRVLSGGGVGAWRNQSIECDSPGSARRNCTFSIWIWQYGNCREAKSMKCGALSSQTPAGCTAGRCGETGLDLPAGRGSACQHHRAPGCCGPSLQHCVERYTSVSHATRCGGMGHGQALNTAMDIAAECHGRLDAAHVCAASGICNTCAISSHREVRPSNARACVAS